MVLTDWHLTQKQADGEKGVGRRMRSMGMGRGAALFQHHTPAAVGHDLPLPILSPISIQNKKSLCRRFVLENRESRKDPKDARDE